METKYTKGVWKVEDSGKTGYTEVSFGDFKGGIECWYHHGDTSTKEEAQANAKLIAAAPGMLECLIDCKETLNILILEIPAHSVILMHEMTSRLKQIEDRIKKATE